MGLEDGLNIIKNLGKAPPPDPLHTDLDVLLCPMCNHKRKMSENDIINTGKALPRFTEDIYAVDPVCKPCKETNKLYELATIVSLNTREVIGRLEPHKDPKSGFKFEGGKFYHMINVPNDSKLHAGKTKGKIYQKFKHACDQKGDKCFLDTFPITNDR